MIYSVLIADDELNARNYLKRLIESNDKFQFLDALANGLEVLKYCKTRMPDVLFLDIEMPGLNGIETARKIMNLDPKCLIIFTTAFNQYAISAFEVEAIGYLLKPFSSKDFNKIAEKSIQLLETRDKATFNDQIERLWEKMREPNPSYLEVFEIKNRGLVSKVHVDEIHFLQSDSEYIQLHTQSQFHLIRTSLEMLMKQLPPYFKRIHRSAAINMHQIDKWEYLNNSTYQFNMKNGKPVISSRSYQKEITDWLS
ncbi:LytR/AlgR family response regulator transcription factor [Ekhidna sp.]